MSDLYWLTDEQMERLRPHFPRSHGKPSVDDRRVLSGIIFVNRNGLRWRDAPAAYGPHKTLYNRWKRWSEAGAWASSASWISTWRQRRRVRPCADDRSTRTGSPVESLIRSRTGHQNAARNQTFKTFRPKSASNLGKGEGPQVAAAFWDDPAKR